MNEIVTAAVPGGHDDVDGVQEVVQTFMNNMQFDPITKDVIVDWPMEMEEYADDYHGSGWQYLQPEDKDYADYEPFKRLLHGKNVRIAVEMYICSIFWEKKCLKIKNYFAQGESVWYGGGGMFIEKRHTDQMQTHLKEALDRSGHRSTEMRDKLTSLIGYCNVFFESQMTELEAINGYKKYPNPLYRKQLNLFQG